MDEILKADNRAAEISQHRRALKTSKVKPFVLYSLRHTMLTRLGESGAEAFTILKIAGHSSAVISQRYVHPTPALIENAFSRFEAYNATKEAELEKGMVQWALPTVFTTVGTQAPCLFSADCM